jgi:hypothetical protein
MRAPFDRLRVTNQDFCRRPMDLSNIPLPIVITDAKIFSNDGIQEYQ